MIRLSRLTDYAVALLAQMAREEKGVWSASELAEETGLPQPTVAKVLKQLGRTGIITAQRGAAGGYRLARTPDQTTIAAIVEAMDGPIAITDCAKGSDHTCQIENVCPMNGNWNKVNAAIREALSSVTLADMALPPGSPFGPPPLAVPSEKTTAL